KASRGGWRSWSGRRSRRPTTPRARTREKTGSVTREGPTVGKFLPLLAAVAAGAAAGAAPVPVPPTTPPADYGAYRGGPGRTGYFPGARVPARPAVLWTSPVEAEPGPPVAAGGAVYLTD